MDIWDWELRVLIALQADALKNEGPGSGRDWSIRRAKRIRDLADELCRRYEKIQSTADWMRARAL